MDDIDRMVRRVKCMACVDKVTNVGTVEFLKGQMIWIVLNSCSMEQSDNAVDAIRDFFGECGAQVILSTNSIKNIEVFSDTQLARVGLKRLNKKEKRE